LNTPKRGLGLSAALGGDEMAKAWAETAAATDRAPIPAGLYELRVREGVLSESRNKGTPSFKLTLEVLGGEHAGRLVWSDLWLTAKALPMTKRDLSKLGVALPATWPEALAALRAAKLPALKLRAHVLLKRSDEGAEWNEVRAFEVVGVETDPTADSDFTSAKGGTDGR
jgi:hypothetical protein